MLGIFGGSYRRRSGKHRSTISNTCGVFAVVGTRVHIGGQIIGPMDERRPYNNLLRALREPDYALIAPFLTAARH